MKKGLTSEEDIRSNPVYLEWERSHEQSLIKPVKNIKFEMEDPMELMPWECKEQIKEKFQVISSALIGHANGPNKVDSAESKCVDRLKEIKMASPLEEVPFVVKTLWVGDLLFWMDDNYLHSCFAHTGAVISAKVIRNKHTGQSNGYGFIEFVLRASAEKTLHGYNGTVMPNTEQAFRLNWASFSMGERRTDGGPYLYRAIKWQRRVRHRKENVDRIIYKHMRMAGKGKSVEEKKAVSRSSKASL